MLKGKGGESVNKQIREELKKQAEPGYRDFAGSLIPACRPLLGVRIPALRRLAKKLCQGDYEAALQGDDLYFEEQMLRGLVLAAVPGTREQRRQRIASFVPLIDNWSVCDSFCASLKDMRRAPEFYWPLVRQATDAPEEFTVRFGVVCMMDHYLDTPYLPQVLDVLLRVSHPGYYARMGVAWALATAFLRDPEAVMAILRSQQLEEETRRLTLRKLLESRRVVSPYREEIRALRDAVRCSPRR